MDDAIERADREAFTRQPPKTLQARINFLMKQLKTTKAIAQEIGVNRGQPAVGGALPQGRTQAPAPGDRGPDRRRRTGPLAATGRKRRQKQAATTGGITVETRARFGYTAPVGTTDDGRFRRLTVHLPPPTRSASSTPARLEPATSRCARSSPKASKDVYFHDNGNRAMTLSDVTLNDIDYLDY
ncbi:telomere-protecting terminal protein Tpg [Streptomyces nigra]|uniref:telomere-protecting terminal protein Tpg n=1 Tax=Streptomyces nigra TaxID=1827580 RepID=UPI0037FAD351